MDEGVSRRSVGITADRRTVTYNEPLVLESGVNDYIMRVQTATGIEELRVAGPDVSSLTTPTTVRLFDPVPTGVDENFSFSISSAATGDVRPYRVTSIEEAEDGDERVKISAIEVNRSKYALVDNFDGQNFDVTDEPDESDSPSRLVRDLQATIVERVTEDGKVNDINITWDAPDTTSSGAVYSVRYSLNDEETYEVTKGTNRNYIMKNVPLGRHSFSVTTLNPDGSDSPQTRRVRVTTVAPNYGLPAITGVTIQNRKDTATSYIGRNVSIEWSVDTASEKWEGHSSDKPHPDFAWFEVDIVNPSNGSIVHTYQVTDWKTKQLEIPYSDFNTFGLTDIRDFAMVVSISDAQGNEGVSFSRSAQKPASNVTGITYEHEYEGSPFVRMKFLEPDDPDYRGVKVWVSDTNSAHSSDNNLMWDGKGTPILEFSDGTNYISFQKKDVFGTVGQTMQTTTRTVVVADVVDLIDAVNSEIDSLEVQANQAAQDIINLTNTYGTTVSAAQSAQDAVAARDAAQAAQAASTAARDLAEAARDAAQGYENSASTAAGITVSTVRNLLPSTFDSPDDFFTYGINGSPETVPDVTADPDVTAITDPVEGSGLRVTNDGVYVGTKGLLSIEVGRTYRVFARIGATTVGTNGGNALYFRKIGGDYLHDGVGTNGTSNIVPTNTVQTFTNEYTVTQADFDNGTRYVRPQVLLNNQNDWDVQIYSLGIEDITESVIAGGHATAASTSASAAGVSETNSGQNAVAAQTAQTSAETAQAGAQSAESNAATSASNASGSESAAANSATVASNAATTAGASANAAATSASNASSSATDAGTHASAAAASSVTATAARDTAFNHALDTYPCELSDREYFAQSISNDVNTLQGAVGSGWVDVVDPDIGPALEGSSKRYISHRVAYPVVAGDVWEVSTIMKVISDSTQAIANASLISFYCYGGDGQRISTEYAGGLYYPTVADGVHTHVVQVPTSAFPAGTTHFKVYNFINREDSNGDAVVRWSKFKVRNVTGEYNANLSATASASSAGQAQASETAAGQSASAAQLSENSASTAAANALSSQNSASTSATNASGSAATAASAATNAANSATAAGASANAAASSASAAATSATDAGVSSTAASNASVSASAARDAAELAAIATLPSTFVTPDAFFSYNVTGAPDALPDVTTHSAISAVNDATEGYGLRYDATERYITTKGVLPYIVGNTYKVRAKLKQVTATTNSSIVRLNIRSSNAPFVNTSSHVPTTLRYNSGFKCFNLLKQCRYLGYKRRRFSSNGHYASWPSCICICGSRSSLL